MTAELSCPTCNAPELNPADVGKPIYEQRLMIRGHKVHNNGYWWSQCLVCSGAYDDKHDAKAGWFHSA